MEMPQKDLDAGSYFAKYTRTDDKHNHPVRNPYYRYFAVKLWESSTHKELLTGCK